MSKVAVVRCTSYDNDEVKARVQRGIAILLVAVLLLSGCRGAGSGNGTLERFLYSRSFARCGDQLLFILNNGLYRANLDGGARKLLADGCGNIDDVTSEFIIYSYRGTVYRMDWNGSGKVTLADNIWGVKGCTNRWVYYTDYDEQGLHRVSVDGQQIEDVRGKYVMKVSPDKNMALIAGSGNLLLADDDLPEPEVLLDGGAQDASWCDGKLFIGTSNGLYRCTISSNTKEKLSDVPVQLMQADKNGIYYLDGDYILHSLKADEIKPVQLTKESISFDDAFNYETTSFVAEDGWVYFRGKDTRLYRVSSDGKHMQRLTDTTVRPVNVEDGLIHFINFVDKTEPGSDMIQYSYDTAVYRMNADGSGKRKFELPNNRITGQLLVIGNRLYFDRRYQVELPPEAWKAPKAGGQAIQQNYAEILGHYFSSPKDLLRTDSLMFHTKPDASGIFSSNLDGSGEFQMSNLFGWDYAYSDGWLYFHNHEGIYRVNRASGGEPALLIGTDIWQFRLYENKIVYLDDSGRSERGIYAANADGSDLRRIVEREDAMLVSAENGWVYYTVGAYSLYRIRMDGSGEVAILKDSKEPFMRAALSDGYIYFSNDKSPGIFSRIDCSTGEIEPLGMLYDQRGEFQFDQDYVYYIKDIREGVWRMGKKSLKEEQIIQARTSDFKLEGDTVYFIFEERGDELEVVSLQ